MDDKKSGPDSLQLSRELACEMDADFFVPNELLSYYTIKLPLGSVFDANHGR
ncbi:MULTISPECIES: hypothetical protein [unclassified Paenibacillus]|uniref:hypothetical protein n=1 Tax=unclassified Paenibacillus TaxID=185978 RepID=UPI0013922821|nr:MULTISPECIES: hypothetical protein [unclassified Paenibacillus]MCT1402185.1 hypothetical protein [Paenibacillus sp. p3-SID867]